MKKQLLKIVKSQPVSHFSLVTLFDGFALPFVFHVLIIEGLSVERVSPFFLSFSSLSFPTFSYAFSVSFFRVLANGNGVHFSQVLCCHFHAGSTSALRVFSLMVRPLVCYQEVWGSTPLKVPT
ncbi:uncharacterized protein [Malus domestica]|uniref:uncharacterized protein isoform X2 n=1 Tax=Malus domestica TaxID=3750 RepID=UPI003975FF73